ncbi:MAG: cyanophycinase [Deltaproteobacteria bacterium]|nr:cyanophycinase [Deltaproteobacteria bacterium]
MAKNQHKPAVPVRRAKGRLLIIGGHEDKTKEKRILRELADRVGAGKLVVATVASRQAKDIWLEYRKIFKGLGASNLAHLQIEGRADATAEKQLGILRGAAGIFFTGGDQLKITSELGGTPVCAAIQELYDEGGIIAGTSAGASVMSETMLVSGASDDSPRIGEMVRMAPGFGFVRSFTIDQHFAERGRMGRLLAVVGQNPKYLGIGIDENTAVLVESEERFRVFGDGAVYVLDGQDITGTNFAEKEPARTMSIYDVKVHVLSDGDAFSIQERRPFRLEGRRRRKAA